MKLIIRAVMLTTLAAATWVSPRAQDPSVIKLNSDLVTVNVAVIDRKNRPLAGLAAGDFLVTEDGKPVSLDFFSGSGPSSFVIVLDISSSMEPKTRALRDGFKKFLSSATDDSDFSLIAFNGSARVLASSVSRDELWLTVNNLEPFGATALYDAILLGLDTLGKTRQRRRALVILSDGDDNRSRATLEDVEQAVSSSYATVYTVGIVDRTMGRSTLFDHHCRALLSQLAEATGGMIHFSEPRDIGRALGAISYDVRNHYCLGYYAPEGMPGLRHLRVSLASNQPAYNLRHKQSYLIK